MARAPRSAALALLTGCEEQEAVSLDRSIGMAIAIPLLGGVFVWWAWVALDRLFARRKAAPPRVDPTPGALVLAGLLWAAIAVGGYGMTVMLDEVAFSYREAKYDLFSWDDVVGITMFFGVLYVLLGLLLARFARALVRGYVRPRIGAAVVLVILAIVQVVSRNEPAMWFAVVEMAVATGLVWETRRPRVG